MAKQSPRKPESLLWDTEDPQGIGFMLTRYQEWQQIKGFSEATVYTQGKNLAHFARWAAERGLTKPVHITRPILERYQRCLYHYRKTDGLPLSFRSQGTRLAAIRSYFRWLTRNNYILSNPAADLDLPRAEKRLPRTVLTAREAETILGLANIRTLAGLRDRAILETLYSTGMRRMELVNLKIFDVDQERGILLIRQGKGMKDRMIPIGDRAMAWINKYLQDVRPKLAMNPDDGTMFLTKEGIPFARGGLTNLIRLYMDKADLGKTGSCHVFRHTMATLMLEGGADIRYIQQMLGHANISTTEVYTRVSIRKLKEIFMATHPSAKLERKEPDQEAMENTEDQLEMEAELFSSLAEETEEDE